MPALSEILSSIHAEGSIYFCDKLSPPWATANKPEHPASFHYVRSGQCWIKFDANYEQLGPGDLVFIAHGDEHYLSSDKEGEMHSALNGETHLLCGFFHFKDPIPSPLKESLPPVIIIRATELESLPWLKSTLAHLGSEYDAQSPGSKVVINKLTEIVLIELIRFHLNHAGDNHFIQALFDKQIGKALGLIHTQPEKQWTLETLAEKVGMSRAVFAKRFKNLVGQTMYQYLSSVRMRIAANQLRYSDKHVIDIAESVGYLSDLAFAKVFKEHFEMTPFAWRKVQKDALLDKQKRTREE